MDMEPAGKIGMAISPPPDTVAYNCWSLHKNNEKDLEKNMIIYTINYVSRDNDMWRNDTMDPALFFLDAEKAKRHCKEFNDEKFGAEPARRGAQLLIENCGGMEVVMVPFNRSGEAYVVPVETVD